MSGPWGNALGETTLGLVFLDPATGVIAGSAGAAAVLLMYFLKLRRRPVRVSSTLLWERAVMDLQVNVPLRWLRVSLLLLLQLAGVALLAMALARPALEDAGAPRGRVIILIDRSASMGALDAERGRSALGAESALPATRLDEAKRRAAEMIRRADLSAGATEAMVIAFAASPRIVAGLTRDRGALLRAVESLTGTDQPADLPAAMELARAFADVGADEETDSAPGATVVVFSDGSFASDRLVSSGLAAVRYVRAGPAPGPRDNVGVVALSARRDEDDPSLARVFFRLQSGSPGPTDVPAVVRVNGEPRRAATVRLAGEPIAEGAESVFVDAPGRALIEVRIERPDILAADDSAALVLEAPGGPRTLVVAPGARAEPALEHALEALGASLRVVGAAQYESLASERDVGTAYDLVVFDRVSPALIAPAPSISFGADLPALGVRLTREGDGPAPTEALSWRRSHPLMRQVSLDGVLIGDAPRLEAPDWASPLAQGDAGPLIVALERGGVRRVVVGFELAKSTWWLHPSFAVFLTNAADYLAGKGVEARARLLRTDEPALVRPAPGADAVRAIGPIVVAARAGDDGGPVSLGAIERAGVFRVEGAAEADRLLTVNLLDSLESAAATVESPAALPVADAPGRAAGAGAEAPREVWPWFVLAAVILLTAEWWWYAWRSRA